MVGIGGGVPPKVRLDDVVVKIPVGQFPGVVQWDLGKAKQSRNLERTGSLNNPPTSLLTTLTALDSKHELIWLQDTNLPGESERDGRDLYRSTCHLTCKTHYSKWITDMSTGLSRISMLMAKTSTEKRAVDSATKHRSSNENREIYLTTSA